MEISLVLSDQNGGEFQTVLGQFIETAVAETYADRLLAQQAATSASGSANAANGSATIATAQANTAANSANAANQSAASAAASATNAINYATAAENAQDNAQNYSANAQTQSGNAATSAANAANSATAAGNSATAAANSATQVNDVLSSSLLKANNLSDVANAATARSNISAAASGGNSDITSLSALSTPLSIEQGGTGSNSASSARTAIGAAASGVNSDITSITGLTSPLSVPEAISPGQALQLGQSQAGADSVATNVGGTSDAITATFTPAITARNKGMLLKVPVTAANTTTTPTFAPGTGITPAVIVKGTGSALSAGDIPGAGFEALLLDNGTNWVLLNPASGVSRGTLTSLIRLNASNSYGTTNTAIRRFLNVNTLQGSDITYADSSTLGASFTINAAGVYAISYSDVFPSAYWIGISLNTSQPNTSVFNLPVGEVLAAAAAAGNLYGVNCSACLYLSAGSVIRPHGSTGASGTSAQSAPTQFCIAKVA